MALLRLPEVTALTGLSRSTIYRLMDAGGFPKCVKLSVRSVAWVRDEVAAWVAAKMAERLA